MKKTKTVNQNNNQGEKIPRIKKIIVLYKNLDKKHH